MIWGGRTYAEELDEESCCPNPLDEQRRQTNETPYQIIRSSLICTSRFIGTIASTMPVLFSIKNWVWA
jgi:hypothetical protein